MALATTALDGRLDERPDVPQVLIRALFHYPGALQTTLNDAGLAPHELAIWARQSGTAPDIEKLAGWLSVGQQPGRYKPLLEVAGSHLRAGDLLEALPVFRWAHQAWQLAPVNGRSYRYDGVKLLALWGECLYRLGQAEGAQARWLRALTVIADEEALIRLARIIEKAGATQEYEAVLGAALRHRLPGAEALWLRWQRMATALDQEHPASPESDDHPSPGSLGVAVMADVANLDMVCNDQYGFGRRLDYGQLLRAAGRYGLVRVKMGFVPDIPKTLDVRQHLDQVGFQIDLKRPKHSHGRIVANADTAMAAAAVRWASDPQIQRVELWTGDGDFLKVREVISQTWPDVEVMFRSFEVGTAATIRRLGDAWEPIGPEYLQA